MEIIEAPIFTRRIEEALSDKEYRGLQQALVINPALGALIPGGGGLRKLRWAASGKGKSGGLRVIYYWYLTESKIYMVYVYNKSKQSDLTRKEIKLLKGYVKDGLI